MGGSKASRRRPEGCNCVEEANKHVGPFLLTERLDGGKKRMPLVNCSYCPICGKKKTGGNEPVLR